MEHIPTFLMNSDKIDELAKALCAFQGECPAPPKDKEVSYGVGGGTKKYKYSDLATIIKTAQPILKKNGLAITQIGIPIEERKFLVTQLIHESGQWIKSFWELHAGPRAQDQGSELTYYRRYNYSSILGIASDEDDDGAEATKNTPKEKPETKDPKQSPPPFNYDEELPDFSKPVEPKTSKIDLKTIGEMVMPGGKFAGQKIKNSWELKKEDALKYARDIKTAIVKNEKTSPAQLMFIEYGIGIGKIPTL